MRGGKERGRERGVERGREKGRFLRNVNRETEYNLSKKEVK